jgi:hypothetical protein
MNTSSESVNEPLWSSGDAHFIFPSRVQLGDKRENETAFYLLAQPKAMVRVTIFNVVLGNSKVTSSGVISRFILVLINF